MIKSIVKFMFGITLIVIIAGLVLPNLAMCFNVIQREGQNRTDNATYHRGIGIIGNFTQVFGMILIIFAIGCVILLFAHAHRKEREEFQYYDQENYRRF